MADHSVSNSNPAVKLTPAQHKALVFLGKVSHAWKSNKTGHTSYINRVTRGPAESLVKMGYAEDVTDPAIVATTGAVRITGSGRAALVAFAIAFASLYEPPKDGISGDFALGRAALGACGPSDPQANEAAPLTPADYDYDWRADTNTYPRETSYTYADKTPPPEPSARPGAGNDVQAIANEQRPDEIILLKAIEADPLPCVYEPFIRPSYRGTLAKFKMFNLIEEFTYGGQCRYRITNTGRAVLKAVRS